MIEIQKNCEIKGSFVKQSAFTLFTRIVLIAVSMGASIITARMLGPEKKGVLAVILMAPTLLLSLGGFSLTSANVFLIGSKKSKLNEVFWNSALLSLLLGGLMIGLFLSFRSLIAPFFQNADPDLLLIAVVTVPLSLFYTLGIFIPLGERKLAIYNILKVVEPIGSFLAIVLLVWGLNMGVIGGLSAYIAGVVVGCLGFLYYAAKNIPLKFKINFALGKTGSIYGLKCHLESAAWFLIRRGSILLVNRFMASADVGYYVIALAASEALCHLPTSISTVLFPEICSKDAESGREEMTFRVCRNTIFILVCSVIVAAALVYYLVYTLYGEAYLPSVKAVLIMLPGSALLGAILVISAYMRGINRPLIPGLIALVMLLSTVVCNVLLIPRMGIYGASWATTITYAIGFVLMVGLYAKITGIKIAKFLIIQKEDFRYYRQFFRERFGERLRKIRGRNE